MSNNNNNNIISLSMKGVRFASEPQIVCYVSARSELTPEEMNETWWSPAAMKEFFRSAKTLSKEAQRSNFMVTGFEQAYETSAALSRKGKATLPMTLENIPVHQDVVDWCRFGHSWRGLERSSSVVHNELRTHMTRKSKNVVFDLMKRGIAVEPQVVRRAYERASRSSKIFARIIGEADALVCIPTVQVQQLIITTKKQKSTTSTSTASSFASHQSYNNMHAPLMLRLAL